MMLSNFLITFRETLEVTVIVGIILAYLNSTKQRKYSKFVLLGIIAGVIASLAGAWLFSRIEGGFSGRTEELFEAATMIAGALLITLVMIFMARQGALHKEIHRRLSQMAPGAKAAGIFTLIFISILRDGIETVVFLDAASASASASSLQSGLLGVAAAVLLGYALMSGALRMRPIAFFNATTVLLMLFATGLFAQGIHELQEAKAISFGTEKAWDINPSVSSENASAGIYPAMHEKGAVGGILHDLFGYTGSPSCLQFAAYSFYLGMSLFLLNAFKKQKQ